MDASLNDAIMQLAVAIVTVLAALLTRYAVPWLRANTNASQRGQMVDLAEAAYAFAASTTTGKEVKQEAATRLRFRLKEYGIKASEEDIADLVQDAEEFWRQMAREFNDG